MTEDPSTPLSEIVESEPVNPSSQEIPRENPGQWGQNFRNFFKKIDLSGLMNFIDQMKAKLGQ